MPGLGLFPRKPLYRVSGSMVEGSCGERAKKTELARKWGAERSPLSLAVRPLRTEAAALATMNPPP